MNRRFAEALFLGGSLLLFVALAAVLQAPSGTAVAHAQTAQAQTRPRPTNLRVLSNETSGDDIDKLMRQYDEYLGVPCGYCHEQDPETKTIDYVSDQNPNKETARLMIKMTSDINNKYLSQLGDRGYAAPITCGNCHRGQVEPPAFELKPAR